jgi:hypothetical protein
VLGAARRYNGFRRLSNVDAVFDLTQVHSMQLQPDLPPEVLAPVDTRVRFSLRGVFIAIALIAAWLAAVTPWFRQWNADERGAFLLVWCSMALGAVLMAVFLYSRRVRAQRRAGAVRFRLPMPIARYASVISLGAGVSLFGLSTAIGFYQAMNPSSRAHGGIWVWNLIAVNVGRRSPWAAWERGGKRPRWNSAMAAS